jgi:hypothetical protein
VWHRYGIPITRSFGADYALWACCGPCALAQETRTLTHYNVSGGQWHGTLAEVLGTSAAAVAAPTPVLSAPVEGVPVVAGKAV